MEAKHTPGPWDITASAANDGRLIVEDDIGHPICALSLRGVQGDTRKMSANAKLIAAAPDLLDALRAAYSDIQRLPGHTIDMLGRIEAAIARATA